jgi:hypothetical protein
VDEVISKAVELLLAAGWRGIAAALLVAILYAIVRVAAPHIRLGPGTPQGPSDENGPMPPGQTLDTDKDHPGGDMPNGA